MARGKVEIVRKTTRKRRATEVAEEVVTCSSESCGGSSSSGAPVLNLSAGSSAPPQVRKLKARRAVGSDGALPAEHFQQLMKEIRQTMDVNQESQGIQINDGKQADDKEHASIELDTEAMLALQKAAESFFNETVQSKMKKKKIQTKQDLSVAGKRKLSSLGSK